MIDVMTESTLTLSQACKVLPHGRNGSRPHLSTLLRWIMRGVKSSDGRFVKLEAVRFGQKWLTSREAVARFVDSLTPRLDDSPASPPRSPSKRRCGGERAIKELEKLGI